MVLGKTIGHKFGVKYKEKHWHIFIYHIGLKLYTCLVCVLCKERGGNKCTQHTDTQIAMCISSVLKYISLK